MMLGMYLPDVPGALGNLDEWQGRIGPALRLASIFQAWGSNHRNFAPVSLGALRDRGLVPLVTWEPWRLPRDGEDRRVQSAFSLASILGGRHDAYISRWAADCRAFGSPLLLRPMHEMNGDWYPWGGTVNGNLPDEFVAAWHRLRTLFAAQGADNVQWVWSPYVTSHPDLRENRFEAYFPGEDAVDWMALDGYNWGTAQPEFRWQSFVELFAGAYYRLCGLGDRPIMIAEVASAEEGGRKGDWIREMFAALPACFPRVRAVVWFNTLKERDWRIDSSPAAFHSFLEGAHACTIHPDPERL